MNLQMIKSISGKDEYVLLPVEAYRLLKKQIDKVLSKGYDKFDIEEYIQNPIALARINAHLTQEELADQLEVTQAYISKIENQVKVSPKLLKKIDNVLAKIQK
jgi:DNA-binding XRE family transcriptional regulator